MGGWFDTQLTLGDIDKIVLCDRYWLGALHSSCTVVSRHCLSGVITQLFHLVEINTKV